jgi:hypothetical protein
LHYTPTSPPIRFFINIYGTFADLSGRFAQKYDNLAIPTTKDGLLDADFIRTQIPREGVIAMMEEEGFWRDMLPYKWHMLVMQDFYKLCGGEYYLLLPMYDSLQLEDRLIWVWRHFGNQAKDRTMLLTCETACLLIKSRNDILIGSDLVNCEAWASQGGSSFWWSEIDYNCKDPAKILAKRIKLLTQVVADLKELSVKK